MPRNVTVRTALWVLALVILAETAPMTRDLAAASETERQEARLLAAMKRGVVIAERLEHEGGLPGPRFRRPSVFLRPSPSEF